jgi:SpoVK/Ycf46/Vps4 family AAA+-type ATPase
LENVVYIATTNYIEKLKERIINRPSRFDRRIYVPFLDFDDRVFFFNNKLKPEDLKKIDVNKWAEDTEGMSIAHLAELIKSVLIFGSDYDEIIQTLRAMQDFKNLSSYDYENESQIGFKSGSPRRRRASFDETIPNDEPSIHGELNR